MGQLIVWSEKPGNLVTCQIVGRNRSRLLVEAMGVIVPARGDMVYEAEQGYIVDKGRSSGKTAFPLDIKSL